MSAGIIRRTAFFVATSVSGASSAMRGLARGVLRPRRAQLAHLRIADPPRSRRRP